jgi:hypothetical protein
MHTSSSSLQCKGGRTLVVQAARDKSAARSPNACPASNGQRGGIVVNTAKF